jgi:hypothetical protein
MRIKLTSLYSLIPYNTLRYTDPTSLLFLRSSSKLFLYRNKEGGKQLGREEGRKTEVVPKSGSVGTH